MTRPRAFLHALARRFIADRRGATAVIVGLTSSVLIGFTGFAVDIGHVMYMQRKLQASADAAAMAGAQQINCCATGGAAVDAAIAYSATPGGKNAIADTPVTFVSGYPLLKCLKSTGLSCAGSDDANAIQVKEQASVKTIFAEIFGITSIPVFATSTAEYHGGIGKNIDVMVIIDSTASMSAADDSCAVAGASRETCSEAGVRTLLEGLDPQVAQVGLMTFPGLKTAGDDSAFWSCSSAPSFSDLTSYANDPAYGIVPFSTDYKSSPGATTLNPSSDLALAVDDGGSGCSSGLAPIGGYGTYYAGIIAQAQSILANNGNPTHQKVIIIASDGGANALARNVPAGMAENQCQEAIAAAQAATAAGTWVYSIAYGSDTATGSGSTCTTDTSGPLAGLSSCTVMQDMASTPAMFYADGSGGEGTCASQNQLGELTAIFGDVAQSLTRPRLITDNTT